MRLFLPILSLFAAAVLLAPGCSSVSESRANPSNWFDSEPVTTLEPDGGYTPSIIDNRPLVDQIVSMRLEVTTSGAIIRAVGLPPRQEFWNADLVRVNRPDLSDNTAMFEFRLRPPLDQALVGTPRSREITAGAFMSNVELRGISRIVVVGAQNSREVRR